MKSTLILVMNIYFLVAIIIGTITYIVLRPKLKKCILWIVWVIFVGIILFCEILSLLN